MIFFLREYLRKEVWQSSHRRMELPPLSDLCPSSGPSATPQILHSIFTMTRVYVGVSAVRALVVGGVGDSLE